MTARSRGEIDGVRPRDTAAAASYSADATSGSERRDRDMMEGDATDTAHEPMPTTTNDNDNDFRPIRTDSDDCASDTMGSPQGERLDTSMGMGVMGYHPLIKPEPDVSVPCHLVVDEDDPYFQCF